MPNYSRRPGIKVRPPKDKAEAERRRKAQLARDFPIFGNNRPMKHITIKDAKNKKKQQVGTDR